MEDEYDILDRLRKRDIKAFKRICCDHSEVMTTLAFTALQDELKANQVVDDVFYKFWNNTDLSTVKEPVQQYLYAQVLKLCETSYPELVTLSADEAGPVADEIE
jgi:hypothetical protein